MKKKKSSSKYLFKQQEMSEKAEECRNSLNASTWHELETNGKFDKNDKLIFNSDDMLIQDATQAVKHYARAIDTRGKELSKSAFLFSNTKEGFERAKDWAGGSISSNPR